MQINMGSRQEAIGVVIAGLSVSGVTQTGLSDVPSQ